MQRLLLLTLIASASTLVLGQTNPAHIGYIQTDMSSACRGGQLSVRHVSDDAAMGGLRQIDYAFTNTSSSPCTLSGYPRFELLNRSGQPRRGGRAVNREQLPGMEENQSPQLVTLAPGQTAWFRVHHNSGGAGYVGKPCPTSPKVRITAPGIRRGFILREEIQSCREVEISSVRSGLHE